MALIDTEYPSELAEILNLPVAWGGSKLEETDNNPELPPSMPPTFRDRDTKTIALSVAKLIHPSTSDTKRYTHIEEIPIPPPWNNNEEPLHTHGTLGTIVVDRGGSYLRDGRRYSGLIRLQATFFVPGSVVKETSIFNRGALQGSEVKIAEFDVDNVEKYKIYTLPTNDGALDLDTIYRMPQKRDLASIAMNLTQKPSRQQSLRTG